MYPTFTGSTRSRRQVNLSGRNSNPFAAYGASKPSTTIQTAHGAVAHAQQERVLREQERQRPLAAVKLQKTWRGYRGRRECRYKWKELWDSREAWDGVQGTERSYGTAAECLEQLRLLAQFASPRSSDDARRISHFARKYLNYTRTDSFAIGGSWMPPSARLAKTIVQILGDPGLGRQSEQTISNLITLLTSLVTTSSHLIASYSSEYYRAVNNASSHCNDLQLIRGMVLAPLHGNQRSLLAAYDGFAWTYLAQESLPGFNSDVQDLCTHVHYDALVAALEESLPMHQNRSLLQLNTNDGILWLLAYFIYFQQHQGHSDHRVTLPDASYVKVVSRLISALADDVGERIDAFNMEFSSRKAVSDKEVQVANTRVLPDFVRSQILSLVSQENVSGLLAKLETRPSSLTTDSRASNEASALASYVLTLLRVFPKRRNDIQLWLYRGSVTDSANATGQRKLPATKYLCHASQATTLFKNIAADPGNSVRYLTPQDEWPSSKKSSALSNGTEDQNQEWRVILLFLELFSFTLQVMDDEEFLAGRDEPESGASWTKQSALPIHTIKELSGFLKNLAFALYWYGSRLAGQQERKSNQGLAAYFGKGGTHEDNDEDSDDLTKVEETEIGGINGMTLVSLKGVVTAVLRMIYQRDSRRKFLPKGHWLMTKYFEMDRFIASVVEEEEHGRQIEQSYDADDTTRHSARFGHTEIDQSDDEIPLVGTQRAQLLRHAERLRARQRKASKRRYLESVTPRLRILENMPFFIPFHTRVQIFREFVSMDQLHRRGTSDPDEWRYAQMHSLAGNISRHRATVRREHVFDDAYKQYYELGDGLKEPIQIRFVDQFNTVEEGIDGGGVTKEFLTSVTNEAFGAANGLESLFSENDQHLLYPNPSSVEERKETLRQAMFKEGSPDWNDTIRDLLRRYEFLGRLIGKCLYEGILIDIHFASFFLLKWALTGGIGSGSKESGYRANLNDLRDLDEGLYQGLLQLKNYPGNVQEDFALDFTANDILRLSPTQTKTVTRELRPDGSNIPVTNENRLVYIASIARHRLQSQPYAQTSAFLRGLGTIISPSWLSMFNQSELQTLIGGSGADVSIDDLRLNTQYGGVYALGDDGLEHPSIQMFWKVLQEMSSDEVAKVLKFVTSTPRAPLLGFGNLNPKFSIRDSGSDETRLPSTSTCVNLLKLPIYKDPKVLKEKLLYSVNAGAGFNLS